VPEHVLIVDDERLTRETLVERLGDDGFDADACESGYDALERLEREEADVVITDLRMPSMDGAELHRRIKARWMLEGAEDYLTKPVDTEELIIRLRRTIQRNKERLEIRRLRAEAAARSSFGDLVYRSPLMAEVVRRALAVADTDISVLIQGATGTGKEVLAKAIHAHSLRASGPFVAVNCAGLNPNLVESELFGHEAGAFTGATRLRRGRIEVASGGTLLIDEVDDLPPEIQVRLLRFLQDQTFERVGSSRTVQGNVRVLCATKHDLCELVDSGRFREDLFYRINTVVIEVPDLHDRKEDILPLIESVVREECGTPDGESASARFTPGALRAMLDYPWPGNVRELKHAVEHALAFAGCGQIELHHLPPQLERERPPAILDLCPPEEGGLSLPDLLHECEQRAVDWALGAASGNQVRAAELLGIPRTTLRSRLASLRANSPTRPAD
jgi:DNA-binding NtrC family response regulator